ncbi:MAG: tetratricopeptide repeat protein [Planctomycetota bacterium]
MADVKELYLQGLSLYGQGKHAEAIDAFQQALALDPERAECLQALSMAQMHAGKLKDALESVLRLTEMTPSDPQAFTSLSMIYQRMDRIDDAEKAQAKARMLSWKEELKTNPNAPPPADPGGMNVVQ